MPTHIDLHIHLIVVINENEISNVFGGNTLQGGQLRQLNDMCIKNTLAKCVAFNFGFHFWCLGFIF
jgi:hypothetical protein